jgi:hypothetical protein
MPFSESELKHKIKQLNQTTQKTECTKKKCLTLPEQILGLQVNGPIHNIQECKITSSYLSYLD